MSDPDDRPRPRLSGRREGWSDPEGRGGEGAPGGRPSEPGVVPAGEAAGRASADDANRDGDGSRRGADVDAGPG